MNVPQPALMRHVGPKIGVNRISSSAAHVLLRREARPAARPQRLICSSNAIRRFRYGSPPDSY